MSNDVAIQVEGLGKEYRIGETKERYYRTLRDTLTRSVTAPFRAMKSSVKRADSSQRNGHNKFWALKDISFEVKRGEVLGVIGRNGAGKSTLLKILSRITEPTLGYADITGRVGSLLEVGTGFHAELSGRENIYLNGAILGMKRTEIERKFDEMVAFAEVEDFVDTPVKHYSSGMYLRLAFAVAAHLEPEILLVDEVLAVGDIAFQKKCLGKMEEVAAHGRTVLFVSHNLGAIKELCTDCLVLENGRIAFRGSAAEGVMHYSRNLSQTEKVSPDVKGWRQITVNGQVSGTGQVASGSPFVIDADLALPVDIERARIYCIIDDPGGMSVAHNFADLSDLKVEGMRAGHYRLRAEVPALWLVPNIYSLYFKLISKTSAGLEKRYESARVMLDITDGTKQSAGKIRAVLIPAIGWTLNSTDRISSPQVESSSYAPVANM